MKEILYTLGGLFSIVSSIWWFGWLVVPTFEKISEIGLFTITGFLGIVEGFFGLFLILLGLYLLILIGKNE